MQSEELFALADQLRELKETKKYAEQELKEITAEIDRVDAALAEQDFRDFEEPYRLSAAP